jgi:hydrogenase-1 operon protein HyaF
MSDFPLPVRVIGAGSQPVEDDELRYLAMPHEMNTFRMPAVPERADASALAAARDALASFLRALERWDPVAQPQGPQQDLADVPPEVLAITNQMLGEGEVSIKIDGVPAFRIQESVFTGFWRVCAFDGDGTQAADWLEAAALPRVVAEAARQGAFSRIAAIEMPAGAMNSPALLAEIDAQMRERRGDGPAHVVNLTLFPMTPDDHDVLDRALPVGRVAMISRGFGNCRITSTLARDVWRVQYFNSMNTLILNTIEVVAVPEVALAAAEDLEDSRVRLAELVDWMSESCVE